MAVIDNTRKDLSGDSAQKRAEEPFNHKDSRRKRPPDDPISGLKAPIDQAPAGSGKPRTLTAKQLRLPFFARALEALSTVTQSRDKVLPRLRLCSGERRTRLEVYQALEAISSPMLARYDLATGILGWLDDNGAFHLSNQGALARDSRLSTSIVNRLFKRLSAIGYVRRRIELVTGLNNGERFIRTRVLIHFTNHFWRDMRLSLAHGRARKAARKRRAKKVMAAHAQLAANHARLDQERKRRDKKYANLYKSQIENIGLKPQTRQYSEEHMRRRTDLLIQLKIENPTLPAADIREMADRLMADTNEKT